MAKATRFGALPRVFSCGLLGLAIVAGCSASFAQVWRSDGGQGTYTNPPLNADYPDPDIIRVGGDFYFASTTFVNTPGLVILHSKDLVNWDIVGHRDPQTHGQSEI